MVAKTESLLLLTMSMFFIFMKKIVYYYRLGHFWFFREEENNDDKKGDDLKRFEYSGPDVNGMMVLEKEFHSQVKVTQCEYKLVKDQVCTLNRVQYISSLFNWFWVQNPKIEFRVHTLIPLNV